MRSFIDRLDLFSSMLYFIINTGLVAQSPLFFTTKPTSHRTGLGISLSYDIIKAQGGKIIVDTKIGEGTTFTIKLPAKT